MRQSDVIIRKAYEQNLKTFSTEDRIRARSALNTYVYEITRAGLRWEFDHHPRSINQLLDCARAHHSEVVSLKARAERFKEFIKFLESLENRTVVQLNPGWYRDGAAETIARVLDPQAVSTYRAFHAALVTYLGELSQESPDWSKVADLARQVAATVNPEGWRQTDASEPERGVANFDTQQFLEAILAKPEMSTD